MSPVQSPIGSWPQKSFSCYRLRTANAYYVLMDYSDRAQPEAPPRGRHGQKFPADTALPQREPPVMIERTQCLPDFYLHHKQRVRGLLHSGASAGPAAVLEPRYGSESLLRASPGETPRHMAVPSSGNLQKAV